MRRRNLNRLLRREWPRITLAVRGTITALAALAIAVMLKLECPYWAPMTALIVIQPTRGLLLEKSFYRLVGTAVGSTAGILMLLSSRSPIMLTLLLTIWLAGCVGIGNLLYGLRSYGALVAGFTGSVIALAGYNSPPHLHDLVFGRIACITIGIVVATTVTLFVTQRRSKRELLDRLTRVAAAAMELVAFQVRGETEKNLVALRQEILMEIADIEGSMDAAWAGSLDLKQRKRRIMNLIVSLLSLLEAGKLVGDQMARPVSGDNSWREPFARHLEEVARHLDEQGATGPEAAELAAALVEAKAHLPLLGETLGELVTALQLVIDEWDAAAQDAERPAANPFIRHRDWREAGRAALRAAFAMAAVGTAWHLTGWREGPMMLMAASIMVSIFSTHDRPAVLLNHIFCGASIGVATAVFCRLVLLPGVSDPILQGAISAPVLLACIIAQTHRGTAMGAMDAMLFFLFVMQPGLPTVPPAPAFVEGGLAALGGIGVAIISFRFLLPIDPARRLRSILVAIVSDLIVMSATDSLPTVKKRRARTHHRVLGMLVNARKLDNDLATIVEGGLAALAIGRCLQRLREAELGEGIPRVASGAIRETMIKLSAAIRRPDEILGVLEKASATLFMAMELSDSGSPRTPARFGR